MNVKFEVKVSKAVMENWLEHHKECGYELREAPSAHEIVWYSTAPGYGILTPAAVILKGGHRYIFVRLADKEPL